MQEFFQQMRHMADGFIAKGEALGPWEFWLNRYQTLIGALATLAAGWLAYRAARAASTRAEKHAREAKQMAVEEQLRRAARDLDLLKLAASYLSQYTGQFPDAHDKAAYFNSFRLSRAKALDFVSSSAAAAPGGYGERIQTLMTRAQQLGDRIQEQLDAMGGNQQASMDFYSNDILVVVSGLRSVVKQIRADIPGYENAVVGLRDQLARLERD